MAAYLFSFEQRRGSSDPEGTNGKASHVDAVESGFPRNT